MVYDYENGYAATHTDETVARINDRRRGPGRVKIRYDVIKRDGKCTIVHHDFTAKELKAVRAEIERQSNELW